MPKYFYVCTNMEEPFWVNADGYLRDALDVVHFIGGEYWPYTRREARLRGEHYIYQFDRQTLRFIKEVK